MVHYLEGEWVITRRCYSTWNGWPLARVGRVVVWYDNGGNTVEGRVIL